MFWFNGWREPRKRCRRKDTSREIASEKETIWSKLSERWKWRIHKDLSADNLLSNSNDETIARMTQPPSQSLSISTIHQYFDEVLKECNQSLQIEERPFTTIDRVADWSSVLPHDESPNVPLYFGMLINASGGAPESGDELVTFYIGYSTWDGRCLFVDRLPTVDNEKLLLQVLAKLAVRLGCRRLLWLRTKISDWPVGMIENPPETLQDWLVLRMDRAAMETYVGKTTEIARNPKEEFTRAFVETQVAAVCLSLNYTCDSKFRLRLAASNNKDDAEAIARLVHGLAVYEKEPDAVQCTAKDYLLDGSGSEPLFYCLLIDYHDLEMNQIITCGMAVIYFGFLLGEGRFLYLEDLYFEEAFRKKGGGSLTLQILADIGLRLRCESFYWTALDWNTPALNLYAKIGAKVQPGLRISRYTDSNLVDFANDFSGSVKTSSSQ